VSPFDAVRLGALARRHRTALVRYVARYTGDPDLAEDVVQETFLRLRVRPPSHQEELKGWLFTVATHMAVDRMRVARRRAELEQEAGHLLPVAEPPPDPATNLERQEARRMARDALAGLSEKERTALLMREEGFTHREIGTAVGTTTKSVGTLLARAFDKFAARLQMEEAS
jgi:RNA polymerase sigma factor (sigma-70 family)